MEIRNMRVEDYDGVYALWLSCKGMGLNDVDDSREGIARYLARNPDTCFVAEEAGAIVGTILGGHDGRRGFLYHAAVAQAYRGRGIGSALVDAAIRVLREAGITKVGMMVFANNDEGNAYWEKRGFSARPDVMYRNIRLAELVETHT